MLWPALILIFIATALVAVSVLSLVFSDERLVARNLSGLTAYETGEAARAHPLLRPFSERVLAPMGQGLTHAVAFLTPERYRAGLNARLVRAGSPRSMTVGRFVAVKVLVALGATMLVVAIGIARGTSGMLWLSAAGLIVLGFYLPDLWLSNAISERQLKIRRELPDLLDMLTISVEAGLGFDAAVAKLVRSTHGPLSREFGQMLKQIQAGVDRRDALRALAERTDVAELSTFIGAIIQAETFGVSIANVLRTQAKEMRLKRRQYAEEQGQKVPVKIVFPLILCILPATMVVVIGPGIVSIMAAFNLF